MTPSPKMPNLCDGPLVPVLCDLGVKYKEKAAAEPKPLTRPPPAPRLEAPGRSRDIFFDPEAEPEAGVRSPEDEPAIFPLIKLMLLICNHKCYFSKRVAISR